jgi:signal transduction histidine kinase
MDGLFLRAGIACAALGIAVSLAPVVTRPMADWVIVPLVQAGLWLGAGLALVEAIPLEIRCRQAEAKLRTLREMAEEAMIEKVRIIATISHDLRQPLQSLSLGIDLLRQQLTSEPEARHLEKLSSTVEAMTALLDGLLSLSRLDAGVQGIALNEFALQPLFDRVAGQFLPVAQTKGLNLKVLPTNFRVKSDATLLENILRNFLSNAIRFTDCGGVLLAARRRGGWVEVGVWDTGPGIPEDAQSLIFEEFRQLRGDRAEGSGLGLAIVLRLARLLGHPLDLRSRLGQGSKFAIRLPRAG